MLLSFQVKNFRSILDISMDMKYAEKKAPNGYSEMEILPFLEEKKIRTVPCLALYGANASGKSNIIKAFYTLNRIVSQKYEPENFKPNKLHNQFKISTFTIKFLTNENIFIYKLSVNNTEITHEELFRNEELIYCIKDKETDFSVLATDDYPISKLKTIFSVECFDKDKKYRTPYLKIVGEKYAGLNLALTDAYKFITQKLEVYNDNRFPFTLGIEKLAEISKDNNIDQAFSKIALLLRKLDIDITRMDYKQNELQKFPQSPLPHTYEYIHDISENTIKSAEINSYHKNIDGKEVQFDFIDESLGTQRVACLLGVILSALSQGHIVVIDELGNSLHPLLFADIIRMFKDKRYNTSNAQLVFSTHNTDIMDQEMMRVSEIGIVKKTLRKGSTLRRIADFEGIRNVAKFRKQYLGGNFSGIPYPYL